MQNNNSQKPSDIEMSLRDLLAQQNAGQQSSSIPQPHQSPSAHSPHDPNIDPAIGGGYGNMSAGESGVDGDNDRNGKGKRELSTSKRAAQNRAAQRAFRQRKEGYIKKLEEQVREVAHLEASYKAVQAENYALRDYIIALQSRLLESQGEVPQPPPNINLAQPTSQEQEMLNQQLQEQAAQAQVQAEAARMSAEPAPAVGGPVGDPKPAAAV